MNPVIGHESEEPRHLLALAPLILFSASDLVRAESSVQKRVTSDDTSFVEDASELG